MTDLISREAALVAVWEYLTSTGSEIERWDINQIIASLPAVRIETQVKSSFEEGFLAGTGDGWVNNPRIKAAWNSSRAHSVLRTIGGDM